MAYQQHLDLFLHLVGLSRTTFTRALMLMAIVLATAAPGCPLTGLHQSGEVESPFEDRDEESFKTAATRQRPVRLKSYNLQRPSSLPSNDNGRQLNVLPPFSHFHDGHRLSNGFLAPLIC